MHEVQKYHIALLITSQKPYKNYCKMFFENLHQVTQNTQTHYKHKSKYLSAKKLFKRALNIAIMIKTWFSHFFCWNLFCYWKCISLLFNMLLTNTNKLFCKNCSRFSILTVDKFQSALLQKKEKNTTQKC